jgi:hypothetical protein
LPDALLDRAVHLYETGQYAESSTLYEHSAYGYEACAKREQIETPTVRDSIALLLMIAGEAAHWAHEPTRARFLAHLARSRFEKIVPFAKNDSDLDFSLTGHIEEVDGDLAGRWTLGVPK